MSSSIDKICCLSIKAQACVAELGYKIALKENSGYCVDDLYEELKFLLSIKSMVDAKLFAGVKTFKNNIINFCSKKVFMSSNNSLFLTNIDSNSCTEELELTEECCLSLCDIESKLNEICRHC